VRLGARNANYLQSALFGDAPKCGEMHPVAASLYAHLYAQQEAQLQKLILIEAPEALPGLDSAAQGERIE
jgi:hypothetical protein